MRAIIQYERCKDGMSCIINKLNNVVLDRPTLVAKSVDKLPLAILDAFNLAKISNDITTILRIEEYVTTLLYALSYLQNDFLYVIDCMRILNL